MKEAIFSIYAKFKKDCRGKTISKMHPKIAFASKIHLQQKCMFKLNLLEGGQPYESINPITTFEVMTPQSYILMPFFKN